MVSLNRKKKNQFEQAFTGNASLDKSLLGQKSARTTVSLDESPLDNCLLGHWSLGQILQHPLKSQRNGFVFRIYIWISVFRRKNDLENCFPVPEILNY